MSKYIRRSNWRGKYTVTLEKAVECFVVEIDNTPGSGSDVLKEQTILRLCELVGRLLEKLDLPPETLLYVLQDCPNSQDTVLDVPDVEPKK